MVHFVDHKSLLVFPVLSTMVLVPFRVVFRMLYKAITFTRNYHYSLHNNPEELTSQILPVFVWLLNFVCWSEEETRFCVVFFFMALSSIEQSDWLVGYWPCVRGYYGKLGSGGKKAGH